MRLFPMALVLSTAVAQPSVLPDAIAAVKPSVVGVGTMSYGRRPAGNLLGTGFVVADGHHVATNAHVIPDRFADSEEFVAVFVGEGGRVKAMRSQLVDRDLRHDLALIRFEGGPLKALELAADNSVREGDMLAFTGYPTETLYGMRVATHRGIVSSIVEVPEGGSGAAEQASGASALRSTFEMLQLDATAFPGNSGSPLYRPEDGAVVGIVSRVSGNANGQRGRAVRSGIAYAVPTRYLLDLLHRSGVLRKP